MFAKAGHTDTNSKDCLVVLSYQHVRVFSTFDLIDRFKCCLCTGFDVFVHVIVSKFCRVGGLVWFVLDAYLCIFKSELNDSRIKSAAAPFSSR